MKSNSTQKEQPPITVIDAVCSSGKTMAMIHYMNTAPSTEKFLFITPYLDEVKRIQNACPALNFMEP